MAKRTRRRERLSKRKVSRRRYSKRRVSRKKNPKRKVSKRRYTKRMEGGMGGQTNTVKMEELRNLLTSVGASTSDYNMSVALEQTGNSVEGAFDLITKTWSRPPPLYMKPASAPALEPAPAPALEPAPAPALEPVAGAAPAPSYSEEDPNISMLVEMGFSKNSKCPYSK